MKKNQSKMIPSSGALWVDHGNSFLNKGVNGRWRNVLTPSDIQIYESLSVKMLGVDCARWLQHGGDFNKFQSNL